MPVDEAFDPLGAGVTGVAVVSLGADDTAVVELSVIFTKL